MAGPFLGRERLPPVQEAPVTEHGQAPAAARQLQGAAALVSASGEQVPAREGPAQAARPPAEPALAELALAEPALTDEARGQRQGVAAGGAQGLALLLGARPVPGRCPAAGSVMTLLSENAGFLPALPAWRRGAGC